MSALRFVLALAALLPPAAALAALQGENLLVPPMPTGWVKAYDAHGNGINMVEYVPSGQTVDNWSEMINVEVFHGRSDASAQSLKQKVTEGFRLNCEGLAVSDLGNGTTSGLPAGRWITFCGKVKETGKGEITYFQAIGGKQNFYLVQRAHRLPPFDAAKPPFESSRLAEWQKFFDQVSVCDAGDPKRPCP
jgi:hypothetical protein